MRPDNFLEKDEAFIVNEYIKNIDSFIKSNPGLSTKALELYDKYIKLLTEYYINSVRRYEFLKNNVNLEHTPFGVYSLK